MLCSEDRQSEKWAYAPLREDEPEPHESEDEETLGPRVKYHTTDSDDFNKAVLPHAQPL